MLNLPLPSASHVPVVEQGPPYANENPDHPPHACAAVLTRYEAWPLPLGLLALAWVDYATNESGFEIWRSTTGVGCGHRVCTVNSPFGSKFPYWDYWVCNYVPPGNWVGQRPY